MKSIINREDDQPAQRFLACERRTIYLLLMMSAGMMGAYTFNVRGGVFCNAQTANIVLMAVTLGDGNFKDGLYYLIPISAYCLGAFFSEGFPSPIKKLALFRWDTCLIAFEMVILLIIGFLPLRTPNHIVQVAVNFIASMQYNTFRQAEGIPMATTFCTNHVRQIGIAIAKLIRKKEMEAWTRLLTHIQMIVCFLGGGIILTVICRWFPKEAIWIALLPLAAVLLQLGYADIVVERRQFDRKPGGH